MKRLLPVYLLAVLMTASVVHAQQPNGDVAPDIGAGKKRAAVCFACHNADGISKIPGTPHLVGQDSGYLENALRAYRDGQTRQNPTMNAMAKPLSDRDIVNIAAYFSLQTRMNNGQTAAQALATSERIRPVAAVNAVASAPANGSGPARSGEQVYNAVCVACHGTGAAGAPKIGAKATWSPRIAQGDATLTQHALQGYKAMPAKGGCAACADGEIKSAVAYMTSKSR
jgi:cytochrome c5